MNEPYEREGSRKLVSYSAVEPYYDKFLYL